MDHPAACVTAGLDFLTVLGFPEGEGLVVEADAEVAGSRSQWIADNGQRVRAVCCLRQLCSLPGVAGIAAHVQICPR